MYFLTAHHFRRFDGRRYGPQGGFDIYHHPFPQTRGGTHPHAGYLEGPVLIPFADDGAYLGRANIKADN
jgi:hypothetical protein